MFVGAGQNNSQQGLASAIVAGINNIERNSNYGFIGGGNSNIVSGSSTISYCFIGAGQGNSVTNDYRL
jgi:hypothetical protein